MLLCRGSGGRRARAGGNVRKRRHNVTRVSVRVCVRGMKAKGRGATQQNVRRNVAKAGNAAKGVGIRPAALLVAPPRSASHDNKW